MKKSGRYYLFSVIMIFAFCARASLIYNSVDSLNEKLSNVNAHAGSIIKNNNYFYWYGEYRDPSNNGTKGVSVYKSRDLIHWHYLGMAFNPDIRKNKSAAGIIERPKVIYSSKLNKFFMYFHHEPVGKGYRSALLGIADSETVNGPFIYRKSIRLNPKTLPVNTKSITDIKYGEYFRRDFRKGQMSRDITVFQDDDGRVYIVSVSEDNSTLIISQLDESLVKLSGTYSRVEPHGYNEAPILYSKNNKYFLMTSGVTGWKPNKSKLYVSDHILSGWKSIGTMVRSNRENMESTFNAQGAFVFKDRDKYILALDKWNGSELSKSKYIFKKIEWDNDRPYIK